MNPYTITKAKTAPSTPFRWDAPAWDRTPALTIGYFLPESSERRPVTIVKIPHDAHNCYLLFQVTDRYVRLVRTTFGSAVWNDSCVEWFVKPTIDKGYFNFGINAGGVLHCSYVEDPTLSTKKLQQSMLHSSYIINGTRFNSKHLSSGDALHEDNPNTLYTRITGFLHSITIGNRHRRKRLSNSGDWLPNVDEGEPQRNTL